MSFEGPHRDVGDATIRVKEREYRQDRTARHLLPYVRELIRVGKKSDAQREVFKLMCEDGFDIRPYTTVRWFGCDIPPEYQALIEASQFPWFVEASIESTDDISMDNLILEYPWIKHHVMLTQDSELRDSRRSIEESGDRFESWENLPAEKARLIESIAIEDLDDIHRLLLNPRLQFVKRLQVRHSPDVARAIIQTDKLQKLESLDLSSNQYTSDDYNHFSQNNITGNEGASAIRDEDIRHLCQNPNFSELKSLDLLGNKLTDEALMALADSKNSQLRTLEAIDLGGADMKITTKGIKALVTSPNIAHLEYLKLSPYIRIGGEGIKALAESPFVQNLREINISGSMFKDEDVIAIANSSQLKKLQVLQIDHSGTIGPKSLAALANTKTLSLKVLKIDEVDKQDTESLAHIAKLKARGVSVIEIGH